MLHKPSPDQDQTADANVHHIGDALACIARPCAAAYLCGDSLHLQEHALHLIAEHLAMELETLSRRRAQQRMECGPVLGRVDRLAAEHRIASLLQSAGSGEGEQLVHRDGINEILRVIEEQTRAFGGEALKALRITTE